MTPKFILILFFQFIGFSIAQNIDVIVTGMSDNTRNSKQEDRLEAVLNAKLNAIEKAGVKITSESSILNYQLKKDFIESKAEAYLLPGYTIEDIGYGEDGIYRVVLVGKVSTTIKNENNLMDVSIRISTNSDLIPYKIFLDDQFLSKEKGNSNLNLKSIKEGQHILSIETDGKYLQQLNKLFSNKINLPLKLELGLPNIFTYDIKFLNEEILKSYNLRKLHICKYTDNVSKWSHSFIDVYGNLNEYKFEMTKVGTFIKKWVFKIFHNGKYVTDIKQKNNGIFYKDENISLEFNIDNENKDGDFYMNVISIKN